MRLLNRLQPGRRQWVLTYLCAVLAAGSAVALMGLSGWVVGAVVMAAAVPATVALPLLLIRVLALVRTVAKYAERLIGHKAAIADQISHRASIFRASAAARGVLVSGWQLSKPERLSDFLDDVEAVEYDRLRSAIPAVNAAIVTVLLAVLTAVLAPLVLLVLLPVAGLVVAKPRLEDWVRRNQMAQRAGIRGSAAALNEVLASAVALEAEGRRPEAVHAAIAKARELQEDRASEERMRSSLETVLALVAPVVAVAVLVSAGLSNLTGGAHLAALFLAFAWLGVGQLLQPLARAALARARARAAESSLEAQSGPAVQQGTAYVQPNATGLLVTNLTPISPNGLVLNDPCTFSAQPGRPIAIKGASESGKTTLLKQLAGWLDAPFGDVRVGGIPAFGASAYGQVHLSLHDAAILTDTVRENLFAAPASDDALWAALEIVELDELIAAKGGLDAWISQAELSMGEAQRLNLARALLTQKPIVLLDEPWEHLDVAQGERIASAMLRALRHRSVVFTTHHGFQVPAETISLGDQDHSESPVIPSDFALARSWERSGQSTPTFAP